MANNRVDKVKAEEIFHACLNAILWAKLWRDFSIRCCFSNKDLLKSEIIENEILDMSRKKLTNESYLNMTVTIYSHCRGSNIDTLHFPYRYVLMHKIFDINTIMNLAGRIEQLSSNYLTNNERNSLKNDDNPLPNNVIPINSKVKR